MAESSLTAVAYGFIGFYNMGRIEIIPSVSCSGFRLAAISSAG